MLNTIDSSPLADLSCLSESDQQFRDRVLAWLSDQVPPARLQHILRVEQMSVELAICHDLDARKAAQAGLMHDLAKYFKPQRLLRMAAVAGIALDPILQSNPHLLHADISAIVAQEEFGITDTEILQAIAHHTLGQPGMPPLSCVVYLADGLEPGRGDTPTLNSLRQLSKTHLHQAVWLIAEATIQQLLGSRRLIHPQAVLTRNWAMQMVTTTPTPGLRD
jgi:predicted HD superfamily hydrolase involved in NAD metabolism